MRMHTRDFCKAALGAILLGLVACSNEPESAPPADRPAKILRLDPPAQSAFRSFPGEVVAIANGRLSFDVGGRLVEFPVYDGMAVESGQLLGRLDPSDFRAAFDSAMARFVAARDELARQTTLRQRNVISQAELDRQQEAFDVAEAALRTSQRALEDTQLFAPFAGRVAHRFVRNFQSVQPRELVLLLQDIRRLKVDIRLPEAFMSRVPQNATVETVAPLIEAKAEFAALPGRYFDLTLDSFTTRASDASRTFLVSFVFEPPPDSNLLPGMTCNVFVRFRDGEASETLDSVFRVPAGAVAAAEDSAFVWKWDAPTGAVTRAAVEILGPVDDGLEIASTELAPGDEIVVSGVRFLSEGSRVTRFESRKP